MKYVVPVVKVDCPPLKEHWDRIGFEVDEHGMLRTVCPEHGVVPRIESKEFGSEEEARLWVALQEDYHAAVDASVLEDSVTKRELADG